MKDFVTAETWMMAFGKDFGGMSQGDNELKQAPIAPYPGIPTKMPGVCLSHHSPRASPDLVITHPQETDWTQLANDAAANADLDLMDNLPPPLEIIDVDDDAEFQVPLVPPSSSVLVSSTVESDFSLAPPLPAPPSSPPQEIRYLTHVRNPPGCLQDYVFMTVAEEHGLLPAHPYCMASGDLVDLAIPDECRMAHISHYVMAHMANAFYSAESVQPRKKQYSLKTGLKL
jgi:hypothetical protein